MGSSPRFLEDDTNKKKRSELLFYLRFYCIKPVECGVIKYYLTYTLVVIVIYILEFL